MDTPTTQDKKVVKYKLVTYTIRGDVFKITYPKTIKGIGTSKQRQNLEYGAHLKGETFEVLEDGTERPFFCTKVFY